MLIKSEFFFLDLKSNEKVEEKIKNENFFSRTYISLTAKKNLQSFFFCNTNLV